MNILLVDDESLVRTSMARMIVNVEPNHRLSEAEDGEEALKLLQEQPFDLVITDIRMPAVGGLELSKQISERWPDIFIIMLTGYADFHYAQEAIRYNVEEYLLKPASVEHIQQAIAKVEAALRSRRASEEVGKHRTQSLLEKRVHDLFYELPLPYYDELLFCPFGRLALYSFGALSEHYQGRATRFAVKNVIEDVLSPYGSPIVVVGKQAVTAVLFLPEASRVSEADLKGLTDKVAQLSKLVIKIDLTASFGGFTTQLKDIRELYELSLRAFGVVSEPEPEPQPGPNANKNEPVHRIVRSALEMIQERYTEDLTLTSIAATLFVSPNYLSSLFKTEIGSTFTHHLTKARMNRAKQLLRETNMKIYQICELVGYSDQAHFSRMFKTLEGTSPYDYRKKANI